MKNTFFYILFCFAIILSGCKNDKKNEENNISEKEALTPNTQVDTDSTFKEVPNTIITKDFLKYLDFDLGFQEDLNIEKCLYSWCCNINNKEVLFSGKIYLRPLKNDINKWNSVEKLENDLEKINLKLNNNLQKDYRLWAFIIHKKYFYPLNKTIDNPCENYKEDSMYSVYESVGVNKWKLIGETKNTDNIDELIKY